MRVPTRERSYFVAPQPGAARRATHDERVPRFVRPLKTVDVPASAPPELMGEIPVEMATTNGDCDPGSWDAEPIGLGTAAHTPRRLERLFEETRWERVLRRTGFAADD